MAQIQQFSVSIPKQLQYKSRDSYVLHENFWIWAMFLNETDLITIIISNHHSKCQTVWLWFHSFGFSLECEIHFYSLYIWQSEQPINSFFGHVYVRKFEFSYIFGRKHYRKMKLSAVDFVRCTDYISCLRINENIFFVM